MHLDCKCDIFSSVSCQPFRINYVQLSLVSYSKNGRAFEDVPEWSRLHLILLHLSTSGHSPLSRCENHVWKIKLCKNNIVNNCRQSPLFNIMVCHWSSTLSILLRQPDARWLWFQWPRRAHLHSVWKGFVAPTPSIHLSLRAFLLTAALTCIPQCRCRVQEQQPAQHFVQLGSIYNLSRLSNGNPARQKFSVVVVCMLRFLVWSG